MSFPKYPDTRDSGCNWIGEIPSTWRVVTFRRAISLVTVRATGRTHPVALENIESRTGKFVKTESTYAGEGISFAAGDILFGKLRPYLAKAWLATHPGEAVGDFHVFRCESGVTPEFVQRLLLTNEVISAIDGSTYGAKMPRASWEFIASLPIPLPSVEEQAAIARFLDRETMKIDVLIEEQVRLLKILREKNEARAAFAVTMGLCPAADFKPSGLEWIDAIPSHWTLGRCKNLFQPSRLAVAECDEVVTCFRNGQVTLRHNRREDGFTNAILEHGYQGIRPGQLVLHSMDAFAGAIGVSDSKGKCSPEYLVCDPKSTNIDMSYYGHLLRLMAKRGFILAACPSVRERAPRIRFPDLNDMLVPVPPISEQKAIVQYISHHKMEAARIMRESEAAVVLLKERRAALISTAVTGKIDVRGIIGSNLLEAAE